MLMVIGLWTFLIGPILIVISVVGIVETLRSESARSSDRGR